MPTRLASPATGHHAVCAVPNGTPNAMQYCRDYYKAITANRAFKIHVKLVAQKKIMRIMGDNAHWAAHSIEWAGPMRHTKSCANRLNKIMSRNACAHYVNM